MEEDVAILTHKKFKKNKKFQLVKLHWTDVVADLLIFNLMISLDSVNDYTLLIPKHIHHQCSAQIFLIKNKI